MKIKKEIMRFCLAGILAGAIDFGLYYLFINFLSFSVSKAISFTCATTIAYLLNKHWIFECRQPSYVEVGRYIFINLLGLGVNVLTNQGLLNVWPGGVLPALMVASMFTGLMTFVFLKWWVFRSTLTEEGPFIWWQWLPWRALVRDIARRQGFLDPIDLLSQLQNFAQPSEVLAPMELVRSGVVLHARGLMNSLAIQHNLDWVWPYWVECQYDPDNEAFIPRSFTLTQINLTHRNWTALGVPDSLEFPIVDPRGLVTPHYDGWSIDVWIIPDEGEPLIPARSLNVMQKLDIKGNLCVVTESTCNGSKLLIKAKVIGSATAPVCVMQIQASSSVKAWLAVSLRPYNPEGISFVKNISSIALLANSLGWYVNQKDFVYFDHPSHRCVFSDYQRGDVYNRMLSQEKENEVSCKVGMASAAALFMLEPNIPDTLTVSVPLAKTEADRVADNVSEEMAELAWDQSLSGACFLQVPDERYQFLYDAAIRTMILHSPKEVYPGPYIYRRFWFRDAAFILQALLCAGLKHRVRRALDCFRLRQTFQGYFLSQEGEWDSNGEALWIMQLYCEMTGSTPPAEWRDSIYKGGEWINNKRLPDLVASAHAGLLPPGFSAEHLGPNDYYYWDDFWAVAGLRSAALLCTAYKDHDKAQHFEKESLVLLENIDKSLKTVNKRLSDLAIPASPYRRMDTGAIGSLVASYPLGIFAAKDPSILDTAEFLMKNCLVRGGFFHDMTHSGINPYLTLHLAQVLLRAGDPRYFGLMDAVAKLASPTGQWPESIHPRTGGGCMGDGQHVWAAAEWVLIIRNCFVREEGDRLILGSGIPWSWIEKGQRMSLGPAPTRFGDIQISLVLQADSIMFEWHGEWHTKEPVIEIQLPGFAPVKIVPGTRSFAVKCEAKR